MADDRELSLGAHRRFLTLTLQCLQLQAVSYHLDNLQTNC